MRKLLSKIKIKVLSLKPRSLVYIALAAAGLFLIADASMRLYAG